MQTLILIIIVTILYLTYRNHQQKQSLKKREKFINTYPFPKKIEEMLLKTYLHLEPKDIPLVLQGLREYFHVCNIAGKQMVSMPSQVVDVAWHEFILFTKRYDAFCQKGLGKFLHHTPAEAMQSKTVAQEGIKRAWKISCKRESIDAKQPTRLPLLFAIDSQLNIPDGFKYSLNCSSPNSVNGDYCASHIGCSSETGCTSCAGGDSSSNSSGCGGGCGGGD